MGAVKVSDADILRVGSRDQQVLHRAGDDLRIDWGYFYLAVSKAADVVSAASRDAVKNFAEMERCPMKMIWICRVSHATELLILQSLCRWKLSPQSSCDPAGLACIR